MKYKYLSYILSEKTPLYGDSGKITIEEIQSIKKGDTVNKFKLFLNNHSGTHIDAPNHFFENGEKITEYLPETWLFKSPCVIEVNLQPSELLMCGNWHKEIKPKDDILLFVSGWSKIRKEKKYIFENPGIHPEVGLFLRKKYPKLRAIGIDWISICPYKKEELGMEAHRAFLNPKGVNNPILIIEDMDLSCNLTLLKKVLIFPFLSEKVDSSVCTAIGIFS